MLFTFKTWLDSNPVRPFDAKDGDAAIWINLRKEKSINPVVLGLNKVRKHLHDMRKRANLSEVYSCYEERIQRITGTYFPEEFACVEWQGVKVATWSRHGQEVVWESSDVLNEALKELLQICKISSAQFLLEWNNL